jgi:predicted DNA binding protein
MAVIAEFTADSGAFSFGTALRMTGTEIRLERVVPTTTALIPFVWASGGGFSAFEGSVRSSPHVKGLTRLADLEESVFYQVDWDMEEESLIRGIVDASAVVLRAAGDENDWTFRLLFSTHERLATFYQYVGERDIDLRAGRVYTLTEEVTDEHRMGLTDEQYEALLLAVERGHFDTPSEVSLAELAEEFDISPQALSQRVRRANEKVLRAVLLSDDSGSESGAHM